MDVTRSSKGLNGALDSQTQKRIGNHGDSGIFPSGVEDSHIDPEKPIVTLAPQPTQDNSK